jgi:hypothetical protein
MKTIIIMLAAIMVIGCTKKDNITPIQTTPVDTFVLTGGYWNVQIGGSELKLIFKDAQHYDRYHYQSGWGGGYQFDYSQQYTFDHHTLNMNTMHFYLTQQVNKDNFICYSDSAGTFAYNFQRFY